MYRFGFHIISSFQIKKDNILKDGTKLEVINTVGQADGLKTLDLTYLNISELVGVMVKRKRNTTSVQSMGCVDIKTESITQIEYHVLTSKTTDVLIGGTVEGLEIDLTTNTEVEFWILYK